MSRLASIAVFVALLACAPAGAEPPTAPADALTPKGVSALSLDELFDKLPEEAGSRTGRAIEQEILLRFNKSGSDTADLLLSWAVKSMEEKSYPLALDILDQILVIRPDFAEAWNKRATVYYLTDDFGNSIADIRQTLALEPRHFGALSGLGMIFEAMDRDEEAIRVFRRALEINPQLDKVRESLEKLEKEAAQNAI